MKAKKAKKPKKQKLIPCPQCGGIDIAIYEHHNLVRAWFQDKDGTGGLMDFEEETEPSGEFLDFKCGTCKHAWASDEFTDMEEVMDSIYGEVTY